MPLDPCSAVSHVTLLQRSWTLKLLLPEPQNAPATLLDVEHILLLPGQQDGLATILDAATAAPGGHQTTLGVQLSIRAFTVQI